MIRQIKEGEYVHIPAGVVAYRLGDGERIHSFIKAKEPLALMYLGNNRSHMSFANSNICDVFYEGKVYSVREENIYEMEEKK